ncbi:NADH:ubiquinone reductase (H(+)-translocating) [Nocardia seriolae]|uniref:Molybdopterin oxidoreductase n=1 Tax=Nocardia seriolae TaxID=37332 RepID=A0ABC8AQS8_9NOCA|nr:molybdopterin oxidoreductase family protein [Nocardia seriolae]APA96573.1 NADH:ubiquinone reductase (H(+)-translocating) [Nocardia seriolae]GAM50035.1 molybdopterin oxidoreductase [Nocardia seriolae]GAP32030.1 molybdopterin oxidoreductase [Nocardia seriolae]
MRVKVLGACPLDCPDGCSWVVEVADGKAVGLRGNKAHPVTRGALCVKVNRYLEQVHSPDRITHPLRRVGRKGEGRFERITWDEALDEIATRLTGIVDEFGGEAVWPFHGTGSLGYLQGLEGFSGRRFFNALGASLHDPTICSIAGSTGLKYTLGTAGGMDPEDLAESKLILLWGTNPLSSGHHVWKFIQDSGAYTVAIDPVRTRTAERCDEHLAPLPGTDAALALGLMHIIVSLGAQDSGFLAAHTEGWPEFRARVEEYTPERTAEITGLPVERIVALGERIARTRPTATRASQGMQRHAGGGAALRTLACLPGVTGDWAIPGGGLHYSTSGHFELDVPALVRFDLLPNPVRTLSMTRMGEALLETSGPPVKALFVIAANPVASNPDQARVIEGLAREDLFTIVLEHFRTDTADYADIVLPATMQPEHLDVIAAYGNLYLAWNEPAVAPPGECLPTTETFRRLARRMGFTDPALYESDEELADQLLKHYDIDRLRADGFLKIAPRSVPTDKLRFVSPLAAMAGHDPLAGHTPPADPGDGLVLISAASHYFLNTTFGSNPELRRRAGEPTVTIHPDDAAARDITDGDPVTVGNDRGSFDAIAEVSDAVRPGVAATPKGRWAKHTGGATVNATVAERDSDYGGGAVFHDNRVRITRRAAS